MEHTRGRRWRRAWRTRAVAAMIIRHSQSGTARTPHDSAATTACAHTCISGKGGARGVLPWPCHLQAGTGADALCCRHHGGVHRSNASPRFANSHPSVVFRRTTRDAAVAVAPPKLDTAAGRHAHTESRGHGVPPRNGDRRQSCPCQAALTLKVSRAPHNVVRNVMTSMRGCTLSRSPARNAVMSFHANTQT